MPTSLTEAGTPRAVLQGVAKLFILQHSQPPLCRLAIPFSSTTAPLSPQLKQGKSLGPEAMDQLVSPLTELCL